MQTFTARPTTYRGIPMRSRLEATFAAMLDDEEGQGVVAEWSYEPRAFAGHGGQYLPDFLVIAKSGGTVYIEVKPTVEHAYLWMPRMLVIRESVPDANLMIAVQGGLYFLSVPSRQNGLWHCGTMEWGR